MSASSRSETLFVLLLFLASSSAAVAAQGFYANCSSDWILGFGGYNQFMAASCPDHNGTLHASFIDIDDCVTNSEGVLSGKPSGGAFFSCGSCTKAESKITCNCSRTFGGPVNSTLDLNTVISNVDGILGCFDFLGIEVKSLKNPPP